MKAGQIRDLSGAEIEARWKDPGPLFPWQGTIYRVPREDIAWLVARVRELEEALQEIAYNTSTSVPLGMDPFPFDSASLRRWAKPCLEILAGVPTVVYGYFAALTVAPLVRDAAQAAGITMYFTGERHFFH